MPQLPTRPRAHRRSAACAALLGLALAAPAAAGPSITGVCPDGSMFVVKREADVPCPEARRVDPHDLPPIRPTYLPRPYGWQVFQNKQDPNNPYNLVESARTIREAGEPTEATGTATPPEPRASETRHAALPAGDPPSSPGQLVLGADELRDLALIVELSQQRAEARFGEADAPLVVEIAHSPAFESRLREHYGGDPLGPVVLFRVVARAEAAFHANFTFVQGHAAFHPRHGDPRQLGLLEGAFGTLAAGDRVLGYAVLPESTDLAAPLDVYWDDRRISVALAP